MRYFLGFDLSAKQKLSLEQWRENALPRLNAPVPARNFHLTSVFLGQMNAQAADQLIQSIDPLKLPGFDLTFNQLGYFSKPKVLWLGCGEVPQQALQIYQTLLDIANKVGLSIPQNRYIPHISLFRKVAQNPPAALFPFTMNCQFSQLHLFESVSSDSGVSYPIRYSWDLDIPFRQRKIPSSHWDK